MMPYWAPCTRTRTPGRIAPPADGTLASAAITKTPRRRALRPAVQLGQVRHTARHNQPLTIPIREARIAGSRVGHHAEQRVGLSDGRAAQLAHHGGHIPTLPTAVQPPSATPARRLRNPNQDTPPDLCRSFTGPAKILVSPGGDTMDTPHGGQR